LTNKRKEGDSFKPGYAIKKVPTRRKHMPNCGRTSSGCVEGYLAVEGATVKWAKLQNRQLSATHNEWIGGGLFSRVSTGASKRKKEIV